MYISSYIHDYIILHMNFNCTYIYIYISIIHIYEFK